MTLYMYMCGNYNNIKCRILSQAQTVDIPLPFRYLWMEYGVVDNILEAEK